MRKEDMIRMHALLVQMRRAYEATGLTEGKELFEEYDRLGISPVALHKDRNAHQRAIFLLGDALSKASVDTLSSSGLGVWARPSNAT